MEVGACVWGVGEGGHLLSACVGECCERRVEGVGVEEVLLFPSAGKQCPRRVFYGSCWTLISFVPHLSSAAAALSPQKRAPPPPLLPPQKKPRTTRSGLTGVHNRLPNIPHGQPCNKSIKDQHVHAGVCIKNEIAVNKDASKISPMNNSPIIISALPNPR